MPDTAPMIDAPFREFVDSLAARSPTPGGGAAASAGAAMGAALMAMVVRFTVGKKAHADREPELQEALQRIERCQALLLPMVERDMASFERVAAAYKLPHDTDQEKVVRSRAIQEALAGAMVVPEELIHIVRDVFAAVSRIADCVGRNIVSDLGAAAELLQSGARSAELLVRINAAYLHDRDQARATLGRVADVMKDVRSHHTAVNTRVEALLKT